MLNDAQSASFGGAFDGSLNTEHSNNTRRDDMASIWDNVEIIGLDDKPEVKKAVEDKVEEVACDLPDPKSDDGAA